ncbi:hypothetical protein H5410_045061 [Solanum commersonii]|uniref:Uncharacterized protein n=1 Tax=Solanum commersonii TaxID=4109 RepID=A0A9J5X8N3_SOLCO|nr:hypothetical protein H5410_045061 [Solanum commersonii]
MHYTINIPIPKLTPPPVFSSSSLQIQRANHANNHLTSPFPPFQGFPNLFHRLSLGILLAGVHSNQLGWWEFFVVKLILSSSRSRCSEKGNISPLFRAQKTTTGASLVVVTELLHINVGDFANEENLTNGWDDTFDCYYINEDLFCSSFELLWSLIQKMLLMIVKKVLDFMER